MLFLKRLVTALVVFVVLAFVFLLVGLMVLGGMAGAHAAVEQHANAQNSYEIGRQVRKWGANMVRSCFWDLP